MRTILIALGILLASHAAFAKTFYVSNSGNDGNLGTSQAQAWKTIAQVNQHGNDDSYRAGDTILFHGGDTFSGTIYFQSNSFGTFDLPVVVSSYGIGHAIIDAGTGAGFYGYNCSGIKVANLNFVGSGRISNTSYGVLFYLDSIATRMRGITVDSVDSRGFQKSGIALGSYADTSGYDDVRITNSVAADNGEAGISSFSQAPWCHHRWYVGSNSVFRNTGRPEITSTHSGSGIIFGGLDSAIVELNVSFGNGSLNGHHGGGPVGIWCWASKHVVIQSNESYGNFAGQEADGGGFDLDGGTQYCTLQYNYSHDNEGAGFEIAQYLGAAPMHHNTIRYNISENDGRKNATGSILIWGGDPFDSVFIYNNTIYLDALHLHSAAIPAAVYLSGANYTGCYLWNNIFETSSTPFVIATEATSTKNILFTNNDYYCAGGNPIYLWNAETLHSVANWNATGQEMMLGANLGLEIIPRLTSPDRDIIVGDPTQLSAKLDGYKMDGASGLRNVGLDLGKSYRASPGLRDFFGNPLDYANGISLGAHQFPRAEGDLPISSAALSFDTVLVGAVASSDILLYNLGAREVRIDSITLKNPVYSFKSSSDFQRLLPTSTQTISVRFAPTIQRGELDTLKIYYAAKNGIANAIPISGFGSKPAAVSANPIQQKQSPFPNPVSGTLISLPLPEQDALGIRRIIIRDATGREVRSASFMVIQDGENEALVQIDLGNTLLTKGTYFIGLETAQREIVRKFEIVR